MTHVNKANNGTLLKTACAVVFVLFVFSYLYFFQADLLAMAQHVLSGGATRYDPVVGTVVITAVLYLVHVGIRKLGGLGDVCHAFTYMPSLLILAAMTDIGEGDGGAVLGGVGQWLALLMVVVYVAVSLSLRFRGMRGVMARDVSSVSALWKNLMFMACMFIGVCLLGNGERVLHYRLRIERLLGAEAYAKALTVGEKSEDADKSLTMLRAFALSRSRQLGERLFEYPLEGGSDALLPGKRGVRCLLFPEERIFKWLSIRRKGDMETMEYLLYIERNGLARKSVTDYILCGYLLDKNLDAFVGAVGKKYNIASASLPRHYKEALTLYTHLRANPALVYHNEVMDADYADFQKLERSYADICERESYVRDTYGDTYWYYYFHHKE